MRDEKALCLWREFPLRLPVLLALVLAATALFHGTRGLYETTEGRYAECAREMARTGTWLEPVLNGQPHWTKPPLTYLAIMLPHMAAGGPSAWAVRLYLIPCFLVTVAAVWRLAFRLWGDRPSARMGAMVYATSAVPMIASQAVSADYPLTAALAVAQACFWEAVRAAVPRKSRENKFWSQRTQRTQRTQKSLRSLRSLRPIYSQGVGARSGVAIHLFWLATGAAFLVKGPPALLMLPAALAVWLGLPREERRRVNLFAPTALAVFLIAGLGWYALEVWRHPGLMAYWLEDEVVNRVLSDKHFRNPYFYCNFTIYLPVLLAGCLPWGGWLLFRWQALRECVRMRGGMLRLWSGLSVEARWLLWATGFPLAVFMLSRSKLPLYVLPLFVPIAATMGRLLLAVYGRETRFRRWALATAYAALSLFVAGKAVAGFLPHERDMRRLHQILTERCGVRDPSRLAVAGEKALNGLSYYYDSVVGTVSMDELPGWTDAGGERFLLCDHRKAVKAKTVLAGRAIEEQVLSRRWRLLRISGLALGDGTKR